jgi:hypothetical protein
VNCFQTNSKQSTCKFKKVLKTGLLYAFHVQFTDILTKVNTVYYLLCLRGNAFTLFVGNVVDVFLCVAIIKQTITSVGLGLLILGFPRIADNLT